jgi:hypothetical protein
LHGQPATPRYLHPVAAYSPETSRLTATAVDASEDRSTIQDVDRHVSNTQHHSLDAYGRAETYLCRTSKPTFGILGDVEGRIVPVAPPPVFEAASAGRGGTAVGAGCEALARVAGRHTRGKIVLRIGQ